jgi:hypothetical protein
MMHVRITLLFPALTIALFAVSTVRAAEFREFSCQALPKDKAAEPGAIFSVASLGQAELLAVPLPSDNAKEMVMCVRSLLAASANDAKVIDAGFSLFIGTPDGRIATLVGGRPSMTMVAVQGEFTKSEIKLLTKTLKVINGS